MASSWDHLSQSSSSSSQSTATDWRSTEAAGNQRQQLTATKTTEQLRQLHRAAAADAAPSKPPAEAGAPSGESRARDWLEALSSVDDDGVGSDFVAACAENKADFDPVSLANHWVRLFRSSSD